METGGQFVLEVTISREVSTAEFCASRVIEIVTSLPSS